MKITPQLLEWARLRAGLSHDDLALKVGLVQRADVVRDWETGNAQPTYRQAQSLAQALHIPMGYLFLSSPPLTIIPIADYRTLPDTERGKFSPEFEDVLNDALRKRDWLREWRIQEGSAKLSFVGRFNIKTDPRTIVNDIRLELGLPTPTARDVKTREEHLRQLVQFTENAGITVLRSGIALSDTHRPLSVKEFRGFTLADEYAPLIFINTRDTINGRIFTLAHELGHLWTGTSGVSNPTIEPGFNSSTLEVERLCNRVAAGLLVPEEMLIQLWDRQAISLEGAQEIANEFRVSVFVVLIRAYELNLLSRERLRSLYSEAQQEIQETAWSSGGGGGDFYASLRSRNGRIFTQEILKAIQQGSLFYQDGARLLNTHPRVIENAMQRFGG